MKRNFKVNYLARDFGSIKNELKEYAKRYYGDKFSDLSEASINTFLIDAVSYVGDILSYYSDYQSNEAFLATALEPQNIFKLAKELGFRKTNSSTATGIVAMYILIPASSDGTPDYTKAPIIKKGSRLKDSLNTSIFLLNEDIIIDENLIGTRYVVARTNAVGNPTYLAVKLYAPVVSGEIISTNINIGNFSKFKKVFLNDTSITEVVSVFDADGYEYYQVPNLSQNVVYRSYLSPDASSDVKYSLRTISAQRRFVFDFDITTPYLMFGGKQYKPQEDLTIDPVAEPSKFILERYNSDYLAEDYFEPNRLLNGDQFGIAPDNTTITVTYRRNTSSNNNLNAGELNTVDLLDYSFTDQGMSTTDQNTIIESIQVINEEAIIGDNLSLSVDELRDLSGMIYQAQNRAVTSKDYETLVYAMPGNYGSIKRVKAQRDEKSLKNNINLYITCENSLGQLQKANQKIKENIKQWLAGYKMITDTVDILDAKIINFGISFTILVDPNYNKADVLKVAKDQLIFIFSSKPYIGESFDILNIYRELQKVKGVLDVKDVPRIRNLSGLDYSSTSFNIQQNMSTDGNTIYIPRNAIYEIKYPTLDITGVAV
jgi:hypothetical protein